jgi:hypothetical protein
MHVDPLSAVASLTAAEQVVARADQPRLCALSCAAMEAEAAPLIEALGLKRDEPAR